MKEMTVGQLTAALSKLNPNAIVTINVKQYNQKYGKQLTIASTIERDGYELWISETYTGACITVDLPQKAIISNWPNPSGK